MLNRTHSKWISLFIVVAVLVSMLLMQAGIASAATLQPIINPAGGTFTNAQTVTIYNIANGDTAYYTTDGTNPESSNTRIVYSGPFTVYQSETIQAAGYDSTTGWSAVTSAVFYINGTGSLQAPVISPDGGTFTTSQTVTIGDIYGTAYYTTDGSNPESSSTRIAYSGPFTVYQSETINAANYSSAGWSAVTSAVFYLSGSSSNQAPVISPDGGTFTTSQTVTIGDIYGTAYYTTDGSNPANSSAAVAYTGPFTVYQSETINAANSSSAGWSAATSASFDIGSSSTTQPQSGYQRHGRGIRVFARGKELKFDVQPIITNGRSLIPIRQIAEALGLSDNDVSYSNGTVTINNGSSQIQFSNNGRQAYLNGKADSLDVPPQIVNGRMMVPLRAISQFFNRNVQWDASSETVTIQ
ncbi:MAG: chitobiase/beta-hexosaminidase C-terminal domain-containing protein [Thermacetogeniaceae bacterium]